MIFLSSCKTFYWAGCDLSSEERHVVAVKLIKAASVCHKKKEPPPQMLMNFLDLSWSHLVPFEI